MAGRKRNSDARLSAARYGVDHLDDDARKSESGADRPEDDTALAGQRSMEARTQYVEIAIQQAMRRGDFDELPGAGKPIAGLGGVKDPDWWIRRKIEREKITGLGPPAFTLRTENAELDARLDALASEQAVHEHLDDFNRRVIEARRQLLGGPPVVTPTRDIDAELERWRERRTARLRELAERRQREAAERGAISRRERRARRR